MNIVKINSKLVPRRYNSSIRKIIKTVDFCYNFYELNTTTILHIEPCLQHQLGYLVGGSFSELNESNNSVKIKIRFDIKNIDLTFYHEFVHFIQYIQGTLIFNNLDYNSFNDYFNSEIEKEAREVAEILQFSRMKYYNNYKDKISINALIV